MQQITKHEPFSRVLLSTVWCALNFSDLCTFDIVTYIRHLYDIYTYIHLFRHFSKIVWNHKFIVIVTSSLFIPTIVAHYLFRLEKWIMNILYDSECIVIRSLSIILTFIMKFKNHYFLFMVKFSIQNVFAMFPLDIRIDRRANLASGAGRAGECGWGVRRIRCSKSGCKPWRCQEMAQGGWFHGGYSLVMSK